MCKLVFVYSSMNSGKSLAVLTKNYMLKEKGFKTVLVKPAVDTRTAATIATRLGLEEPCFVLGEKDLASHIVLNSAHDKPDFVIVDEAQFLTKDQVLDFISLVDNWSINVHCYGLKLNWKGDFFEGSFHLMKHADKLIAVDNICPYYTESPAFYHIKKAGDKNEIEAGYEDLYESVSRKKWVEWKKGSNLF
jgi:thymidine kinase